ncbi:replication initiation negative regulator SeqA [Thalassotalea castellviae]|uniref:Negative modulator of initiation of replication n=1 Tax=Thalassotalea castellviae TaxID=3075612 RepID=A0ABU3A2U9_9GAMM|nr:replication initiation negative regulator SeqA [Thalassotalea sp. W431]MDT0604492.1 replication initiation negative regulator SeqA [Thalassotalea sp. W431]
MKHIEIDEELYQYLASKTQYIGESASSILRRLLSLPADLSEQKTATPKKIESVLVQSSSSDNTPLIHQKTVATLPRTAESVFNYINKEELATQRGVVGRFLLILSALHRVHGEQFSAVIEIRGRDRLYFARSEQELAESGSSTKPRQIPDSSFWVMTNSNTTRKKMMITEVAKALGYQAVEIEKIRDLL